MAYFGTPSRWRSSSALAGNQWISPSCFSWVATRLHSKIFVKNCNISRDWGKEKHSPLGRYMHAKMHLYFDPFWMYIISIKWFYWNAAIVPDSLVHQSSQSVLSNELTECVFVVIFSHSQPWAVQLSDDELITLKNVLLHSDDPTAVHSLVVVEFEVRRLPPLCHNIQRSIATSKLSRIHKQLTKETNDDLYWVWVRNILLLQKRVSTSHWHNLKSKMNINAGAGWWCIFFIDL